MKALVMIAHGSRREDANAEFIALVKNVKATAATKYDFVEHCFLEISSPSLPEAVDQVIRNGATEMYIFPYFLNSGNHVLRDIPAMVDQLMKEHPHHTFTILPYFGTFEGIAELISRQNPGDT